MRLLAISEAGWGFLGVLATQTVILVSLLINSHRTRRNSEQINRAVNHVPPGSPTLIARVVSVEKNQDWQGECIVAIARHVGATLPPKPDTGIPTTK
jgi:hypothetical protein